MAIQTEPTRIQIPFADSGTKNVIPDTNSTPSASQAASWTDGFPAQCSLPLSAGGIPPARADFNGILNTMSQSIRFGQEGGVWAWDATVDYGTNRVVLGSDGLLYWSVAQSGPNTAAGAKNPTTDVGTYWTSPAVKTMPLRDSSDAAVSTGWYKALATSTVYVSPSGNDSNSGFSSSSPVKTLAQALSLAASVPGYVNISIAAGTYSEDVNFYYRPFIVTLTGNVTISGNVTLNRNATVVVTGSYSLTMDSLSLYNSSCANLTCSSFACGPVRAQSGSTLNVACAAAISTTSGSGISVLQFATAIFAGAVTVTVAPSNGAASAIAVTHSSLVYFGDTVDIVCNGVTSGAAIRMDFGSVGYFSGKVTVSGSSSESCLVVSGSSGCTFSAFLDISSTISLSSFALFIGYGSFVNLNSGANVYGSDNEAAVTIAGNAYLYIYSNSVIYTKNGKSCFSLAQGAVLQHVSGILSVRVASGTGAHAFDINQGSMVSLQPATMYGIGAWSSFVSCDGNSYFYLNSSTTVSNQSTGSRYSATRGAQIDVRGTGANRLPGNAAGTADASQFAYYG